MLRTQQHEVIETRFAASRPVLDMMCIDKARVMAAGEYTAFVPGHEGSFNSHRDGAGLATNVQRLAVLILAKNHCMTVTTQSFDALDGET